jgi:flagellar basal body rod protein FlgG
VKTQTPNTVAIHLAKLASNTSSERAQANFTETVKERGIELAGDGAFTVDLENGQRFHVRVTEVS